MKQLLYALSAICLASCSPKLQPAIKDNRPPLPDSSFVLILDKEERFNDSQPIGIITATETELRQVARSRGANLVKIIANNKTGTTARIYKVDNPKLYETKFEWSSNRKLTWDDYKGTPPPEQDTNVAATTSCRFGLLANPAGTVTNEFICHQSSVRPGQKKPALLAHEQLHFDLCEVYARKLRKELAATPLNQQEVNDAFIKTYRRYKEQQWLYDQETNHGLEPQAQERWQQAITKELDTLAAYKKG